MIKKSTLIKWLNSLSTPQWSRYLSQPTLQRAGEVERKGCVFQRLFEKNIRKTKKRSANFENKGSGVVYA